MRALATVLAMIAMLSVVLIVISASNVSEDSAWWVFVVWNGINLLGAAALAVLFWRES